MNHNSKKSSCSLSLIITGLFVMFLNFHTSAQTLRIHWPEITDSADLVDTSSRPVEFQNKKTTHFEKLGIWVSNEFTGSRLNKVSELNDTTILVNIHPENAPINMSPWYAFRIWSSLKTEVYIKLKYLNGQHRYIPKISKDGICWERIESSNLNINQADSSALLKISLEKNGLWIAAQELITSVNTYNWIHSLSKKPHVSKEIFGFSHQGKPMMAMTISESTKLNHLIILSRQHPPELTGYLEMVSFVETLAGNSRIARKFRKHFKTIVVPMMNPDGVDNGHWRHNIGGIDLNRDWRYFNQPETGAFRKYILSKVDSGNVKFGIDFHSTQVDLFYMQKEENLVAGKRIALEWLNQINNSYPEHLFSPQPTGETSQISKNWFLHELGAESVTYEVGDNTDRNVIRERGATAALILMKMLLKNR